MTFIWKRPSDFSCLPVKNLLPPSIMFFLFSRKWKPMMGCQIMVSYRYGDNNVAGAWHLYSADRRSCSYLGGDCLGIGMAPFGWVPRQQRRHRGWEYYCPRYRLLSFQPKLQIAFLCTRVRMFRGWRCAGSSTRMLFVSVNILSASGFCIKKFFGCIFCAAHGSLKKKKSVGKQDIPCLYRCSRNDGLGRCRPWDWSHLQKDKKERMHQFSKYWLDKMGYLASGTWKKNPLQV